MKSRSLLIALAAHLAVMILVMPATPWEFDEPLFFQALDRYDPLAHHPPPPGYPVFIHFAQLVRLVIPSDFATFVTISIAASLAGFIFLALAFRNLAGGDEKTGIIGALLFYWSPAMLIHSTLPNSDPGGLALLAAALYFASGAAGSEPAGVAAGGLRAHRSTFLAVFASLAVGWRIQLAIFIVPFFLVAVARMRTWRDRTMALGVFTVVCLAWLTPLTLAVGGVREMIDFELGQGKYLAAHDAAESRTGWTPVRIAFRFMGRPWGKELAAAIVFAFAAAGLLATARKRNPSVLPLAAGAAVYIAFALWMMDPADGVRYALPFVLATSFAAAAGMAWLTRRFAYAALALVLVPFFGYVGPMLWQRRTTPSPPYAAAIHVQGFPEHAVALYEPALWPHAHYYLRKFDPHPVDAGLAEFWDRPDVPLFLYTDGASSQPDARVFRWKPSDAYEKMTRNHYRVASIVPVPYERRFLIVSGIFGPEREQDGLEWRWLSSPAELHLPPGVQRQLTLVLGLSDAAPIESNVVTVTVGDQVERATITRGKRTEVVVDNIPGGTPHVRIESARTFIPAEVPSLRSGDRRHLAVELYELRTTFAAPVPPPPAR